MPMLPPLGSLRELFPDQVVETGRRQGIPDSAIGDRPFTGNLKDAPRFKMSPETAGQSPEDEAAGLVAAMNARGTKDGSSNLFLRAGLMGAGPIAGIMSAIGASLAGKDPDFAATMAEEGFRRISQERRAEQALAEQQHQRRVDNLRSAVSVAVSTNLSPKTIQTLTQQYFGELGINVPAHSQELAAKNPVVMKILTLEPGKPVTGELITEFNDWIEETGIDPTKDSLTSMALERISQTQRVRLPESEPQATPGDTLTGEQARGKIVAELGISETVASKLIPEDVVHRTAFDNLMSRLTKGADGDPMVDPELAKILSEKLGDTRLAGPLSRTRIQSLGPILNALEPISNTNDAVFIEQAANQIFTEGVPLNPGQIARLSVIQAEMGTEFQTAIGKAIETQWLAEDNPEMKEWLQESLVRIRHGQAIVPELLQISSDLSQIIQLESFEESLQSAVNEAFDGLGEQ